jgi:hypothetical protein
MSKGIFYLSPRTQQPSQPETPYGQLRNAVQKHPELESVAYELKDALSQFGKGLDLGALNVAQLDYLVEQGAGIWKAWKAQAEDRKVPLVPIALAGSARDFNVELFKPFLREGEELAVEYHSPPDIASMFKPSTGTPSGDGRGRTTSLGFVSQSFQPEVSKPVAVTQPETLPQPTVADMLLKRLDDSITLGDGEGILLVAAEIVESPLLTPSEKQELLLSSSPCRLDPMKVLRGHEEWIKGFNALSAVLGGEKKG